MVHELLAAVRGLGNELLGAAMAVEVVNHVLGTLDHIRHFLVFLSWSTLRATPRPSRLSGIPRGVPNRRVNWGLWLLEVAHRQRWCLVPPWVLAHTSLSRDGKRALIMEQWLSLRLAKIFDLICHLHYVTLDHLDVVQEHVHGPLVCSYSHLLLAVDVVELRDVSLTHYLII
jgi:hypothetical protein